MNAPRTAIVIGGGLIGCSCAWYLLKRGWHVTLVERDRIGSGASHGNCGFICPSHALPLSGPGVVAKTLPQVLKFDAALAIPPRFDLSLWKWLYRFTRECTIDRMMHAAVARNALLASSMSLYRDFIASECVECEWQDRGLLLVYKSARDFDHYAATADLLQREFSIQATPYPGESVRQLEPTLREGMAGGWHFPGDAHVRPDRLMSGLKTAIESRGADIREHVEVSSFRIEAQRVTAVETSTGAITAELVVLATGAEAPRFAKLLGCRIPIQPGKGYSLTMPPLQNPPRIPMIFEEHHVAVTPLDSAFRVGSTMEFTGYDRTLKRRRLALLRRSAEEHLAEPLPATVEEQWTGWRPMVYDGLPCIDRAPGAKNVIVAAGNGMIGLATAPATGKLVAELASNDEPHLDPAPYSLARFS
ncbi:MAG: FAD-dependent oxidoreductase [Gammaproteobacteria bacterium]|nr:FAD-dependent oxidoreductase [Gammaproteobacteria bacterium]